MIPGRLRPTGVTDSPVKPCNFEKRIQAGGIQSDEHCE